MDKLFSRQVNHPYSTKSHCPNPRKPSPTIQVGDLVYLNQEGDKTKAKDKYLVCSIVGTNCELRKFTATQFRSKVYTVPIMDCTRILPDPPDYPKQTLSNTFYDDTPETAVPDSEFEPTGVTNEAEPQPPCPQHPVIPQAISLPPDLTHEVSEHIQESLPLLNPSPCPILDDSPHSNDSSFSHTRTSERVRKPPSWQTNEEWIMS